MVKKGKKAKETEKKARKAKKHDKSEKKHAQKEQARNKDEEDDVDIDQILAEYAKQQETFLKVTEQACEPPSARSSATFTGSPENNHELFLFGGEYFNGSVAKFFNDLFVYNVRKDEWRIVTSPNSPLPRSGHSWCRGGNTGGLYMFGGEFSSPKQGTFYHYNDFWFLDPSSREWTKIETKGKDKSPPARSGHRMTYYKNYIVLFGGFQDTSQQTKYLQDLWLYDCQSFTWHCPTLPPGSQRPDARSSFSLLPHDSGAVLYGGYSRVKSLTTSQSVKGGGTFATHQIMKPVVHQDTWLLRITHPTPNVGPNTLTAVRWERRKRPVNAPNPPRAGATMAHHRGRGIQFGGVHDVEKSEEGIDSEFFNNLFVWNVDRNRYFPLGLRRPRTSQKKQNQGSEGGKRGRTKADEEELLQNLAALQAKDAITTSGNDEIMQDGNLSGEEDEEAQPKPVAWEMPHPRFNAQLAIQGDVVYIYGGTYEKGDREYTFDELWSIDLGRLDGVKEVFKREIEDWIVSEDEDSDDSEGDEEESETEMQDADSVAKSKEGQQDENLLRTEMHEDTEVGVLPSEDAQPSRLAFGDSLPHPRPFEKVRDFFARTSTAWQEMMMSNFRSHMDQQEPTVKELRKQAFERAEEKWWDCREEIQALENEQEAAGIGEVVNIAEKASQANTGAARRR